MSTMNWFSKEARDRRGEYFNRSWKHRVMFVLIVGLIGYLLGAVLTVGLDEAHGATVQTTCSSHGNFNGCEQVKKVHRKVNRRIHDGRQKLAPVSFDARKAFKEPKKAKRFFVKRIMAGLAVTADQTGSSRCCSRGYAKALYIRAMDDTRCARVGSTGVFDKDGFRSWCNVINMPEREKSKIDTDTIRNRGTIAFCVIGSVAGVAAAIPSGGLSLVAAGAGAGACGLASWEAIEQELS